MITSIRHAGIVVADLSRALAFWRDVLGFRVIRQMEESGSYLDRMLGLQNAKATTVKLAAPDGNLIELLHFHSHPDSAEWTGTPVSTGLTHLAFTVDDLAAEQARLTAAGVRFLSPSQVSPDGNVKVMFGVGPEGLLLELVEVLQK
jgi:catechol 2,3-dioxygenase-like lactoylglutathione lyase family enzyme